MNTIRQFFRSHRWQRRMVVMLLAMCIAATGAFWLVPRWQDDQTIARLDHADDALRNEAAGLLIARIREQQAGTVWRLGAGTVDRMTAALGCEPDRQFLGVYHVLKNLDLWKPIAQAHPMYVDRVRLLRLRDAQPPAEMELKIDYGIRLRMQMVFDTITAGRNNDYVRALLLRASNDRAPEVRVAATMLAGAIENTAAIQTLLGDPDETVAQGAAYSAALCNMTQFAPPPSPPAAEKAPKEKDPRRVLTQAIASPKSVLQNELIAAIDAAMARKLPCRRELYDVVETLWCPGRPVLLMQAARALGIEATTDQKDAPDPPTKEKCIELLRRGALYLLAVDPPVATSQPADKPADKPAGQTVDYTTPMGSAAAAVALWKISPSVEEFDMGSPTASEGMEEVEVKRNSAFFLREAASNDIYSAGDYIAWELSRTDIPQATALALRFLPARKDTHREYNTGVLATGAMWLALQARTDDERIAARKRIENRMIRADFIGRRSMTCALLILGDRSTLAEVNGLLEISDFPRRRVLTALWSANEKRSLDMMLLNVGQPLDEVGTLLLAEGLDAVLAGVAPTLPLPKATAGEADRAQQMQQLRHAWGVLRGRTTLGLPK